MHSNEIIIPILQRVGALLTETHVIYKSGRHGEAYVNKDALYTSPADTSLACQIMAEHFANANIEVVAGPTIGGVILSQWVAYHLGQLNPGAAPVAVFAEETGEDRVFRRGYDAFIPGKRVLIVEDILTTGASARKVVEVVRALGGEVVGVAALCNRGGVQASTVDAPELFALTNLNLNTWEPDECPLCQQGVPINTSVGYGGKKK
jgi:orotate phosphoribosyltransferase